MVGKKELPLGRLTHQNKIDLALGCALHTRMLKQAKAALCANVSILVGYAHPTKTQQK